MSNRDDAEPGELLGDPGHARGDAKMIQMAMRKRWPVRDDARGPLMNKLTAIALQNHSDPRINVNAARAILQADRLNQVDELAALNSGTDPVSAGAPPVAPDMIIGAMDASVPEAAAG